MKSIVFALIVLMSFSVQANAATWLVGNIWFGNVCRNGNFFTVYPPGFGQPVGTACLVRDNFWNPVMYGIVSPE